MKIEIKKIVQDLPLRDYSPAYGDIRLQVWVNPPKSMTNERIEQVSKSEALLTEVEAFVKLNNDGSAETVEDAIARMQEVGREISELANAMHEWMAEIWSQGVEETRMSPAELADFVQSCDESDPMLYAWLVDRTLQMIHTYRTDKKKF